MNWIYSYRPIGKRLCDQRHENQSTTYPKDLPPKKPNQWHAKATCPSFNPVTSFPDISNFYIPSTLRISPTCPIPDRCPRSRQVRRLIYWYVSSRWKFPFCPLSKLVFSRIRYVPRLQTSSICPFPDFSFCVNFNFPRLVLSPKIPFPSCIVRRHSSRPGVNGWVSIGCRKRGLEQASQYS